MRRVHRFGFCKIAPSSSEGENLKLHLRDRSPQMVECDRSTNQPVDMFSGVDMKKSPYQLPANSERTQGCARAIANLANSFMCI